MLLPRLLFAATSLRAPRHLLRCSATYAATDALYLGDTSMLETTATVLGLEEGEKGWTAVLDATVFHPQGGGQPSDVGTLGDAKVVALEGCRPRLNRTTHCPPQRSTLVGKYPVLTQRTLR